MNVSTAKNFTNAHCYPTKLMKVLSQGVAWLIKIRHVERYNLLGITHGAPSSIVKLGYGGRPNKQLTKTS